MFHGFYLQHHPPPALPPIPTSVTRSCPVHPADKLFYSVASSGLYQISIYLLLLVCPCVCVHFPFNTINLYPIFVGGHLPQSMGPWLLSPLPCPVPCLCSEAVCCGSTNARVRRKCMSCSPHVSSGLWLLRGHCGVVCLLGCTFWVELYAVCRS